MSIEARKRRLEWADAILEALLEKHGSVKIWEFTAVLKKHFECTQQLAADYAATTMKNGKFDDNGFAIWIKGKKPKAME